MPLGHDLESRPGDRLHAVTDEIRTYGRYARGLRGYLKRPLDAQACHQLLARQRASRDDNFLRVIELAVFDNPPSPYLKLFRQAGIELDDVAGLVRETGLDRTLESLYEAGVYVTLEEVKLRQPVRRGDLEFTTTEQDWDNPLLAKHFEARSGGSRSSGRRTVVDLAHLRDGLSEAGLYLRAFDLGGRPGGIWYPAPPGFGGLATALSMAKLEEWRAERWFSQTKLEWRPSKARSVLLTATTVAAGKLWGGDQIPWPRHAPLDDPTPVARWLAEKVQLGTPAMLVTYPSAAVRACGAALDQGLDIAGTAFVVGGEPYTAEKAQVLEATGARGHSTYGMTEVGAVGAPCAAAPHPDDVHLLTHKVGVIQRPTQIGDAEVGALFLTTLLPASPKLMINVESGDYGDIAEQSCGCPFGEAGLHRHLHSIRSHEKLTSQGMTFLGEDLVVLLDQVLPAGFGGTPQDFQIVEEEQDGVARVTIVVSPRLGALDEAEVRAAALQHLAAKGGAARMMAEVWESGNSLRVERREPSVTAGGKVLPLHIPTTAASARSGDSRAAV